MKIVSSLAIAVLTAPWAAVTPAPAAAEPVPIVEKAIAFHGGDLYESSESSFQIVSKSGAFRVEVRRAGGVYRQAVEAATDEGRRRVVVTNDGVEMTVGGAPRGVPENETRRWRDHVSARVWFPYLPYGLANDGVYTHDLGTETWPAAIGEGSEGTGGTRELHKVKVTFQPGTSTDADDEYLFWFDPETGRLEQLAYGFDGGLRFRVAKNFRRVGGILFSDQENYGIDFEEGEHRRVDEITPELVAKEMEHVSTIELKEIEVRPIE